MVRQGKEIQSLCVGLKEAVFRGYRTLGQIAVGVKQTKIKSPAGGGGLWLLLFQWFCFRGKTGKRNGQKKAEQQKISQQSGHRSLLPPEMVFSFMIL
jgi:hypothetical protein